MITAEEFAEVERAGAVGEVLGRFVDADGRPVAAGINERAVAVRLEDLRGRQVVAIAGGRDKPRAIAAVLRERADHWPDHRRGDRPRGGRARRRRQRAARASNEFNRRHHRECWACMTRNGI